MEAEGDKRKNLRPDGCRQSHKQQEEVFWVKIVLEGDAQEIATFVLAAQGQRMLMEANPIVLRTVKDKEALADSIRSALENQ